MLLRISEKRLKFVSNCVKLCIMHNHYHVILTAQYDDADMMLTLDK